MEPMENALPPGGPAKLTQNSEKFYKTDRRDRFLTVGVLLWCLLSVDIVLWAWPWGMGLTAAVFSWYALLAAALGRRLFQSRETRVLLILNLALAASFSLGSNLYFRTWNLLALLALVPLHICGINGMGALPWWRPAMIPERIRLLFSGLFGSLGALFAALTPAGTRQNGKRAAAAIVGSGAALVLLAILIPVLSSADALFAAATAEIRSFLKIHFTSTLWDFSCALAMTPFVFGLVYRLRRPRPVPTKAAAPLSADALLSLIILAALDGLYLLFLLVQSAGLFGGESYLAQRGLSYAQWARSGFFQMVGVTVLNLSVILAAVSLSRRMGRTWAAVRALAAILTAESLVLLASSFWRMSLYVSAYGLSFKRCMTYWGMAMMALFFFLAAWKIRKPDRSFCRLAIPIALAGWLVINCIPIDYLVARNAVGRYTAGEGNVDLSYLVLDLSYDTLETLDRLDGSLLATDREGHRFSLDYLIALRRAEAQAECADWRSWNLSACLAAGRIG